MRSLRVLAHRLHVPVASLLASSGGSGGPFDESSVSELDRLCRRREYEDVLTRGREILECCGVPELIAGAHYFVGWALCDLARPREALVHLERARELFESFDDDHGRVAETRELEALALQIAEDPSALAVARGALARYRELDGRRPEVEARLLHRLGTILAGQRDFDAARAHYEEALQLAGGVRDLVRLARLYHGIGFCHCHAEICDLRAGTELLFKAHTLYEAEERLAGSGGRSDLARVENDIGILLIRRGDLARAEEYLWSALRRFDQAELKRLRSHVLLSCGELRQAQGRLEEAVALVREAIESAEHHQETRALGTGYKQLGELQAALGEQRLAIASFERSLSILSQMGLERLRAECAEARDRALGIAARARATPA